jgi:calcineurin-like phosphoesterase family protein
VETRSRPAGLLIIVLVVLGLALLVTARFETGPVTPSPSGPASSRPSSSPPASSPAIAPSPTAADTVLLAVGDIASCDATADEQVGALAARLPGTIALLGDNAYQHGSPADYANCFDPTWGALRDRLRPVPGNHEYETNEAAAYFSYFGAGVGKLGEGWYSYDLGAWHLIALNSECGAIRGCGAGSPELAWLVADLAARPVACTLAYWHHPRYSSGMHGDNDMTEALWQALAAAGADVVLEGHDHDYERMAPIDGIRSFVVGTGGRSLYEWPGSPGPYTEVRANDTYGLLQLTLGPTDYSWSFVPAAGGSFTDSGTAACH